MNWQWPESAQSNYITDLEGPRLVLFSAVAKIAAPTVDPRYTARIVFWGKRRPREDSGNARVRIMQQGNEVPLSRLQAFFARMRVGAHTSEELTEVSRLSARVRPVLSYSCGEYRGGSFYAASAS